MAKKTAKKSVKKIAKKPTTKKTTKKVVAKKTATKQVKKPVAKKVAKKTTKKINRKPVVAIRYPKDVEELFIKKELENLGVVNNAKQKQVITGRSLSLNFFVLVLVGVLLGGLIGVYKNQEEISDQVAEVPVEQTESEYAATPVEKKDSVRKEEVAPTKSDKVAGTSKASVTVGLTIEPESEPEGDVLGVSETK